MKSKMKETFDASLSYKNAAHATWQFVNDMKIGDIVFVKKGMHQLVGRGVVSSDYEYDADCNDKYGNIRKVNWTHKGEWPHPGQAVMKTLTDITSYTDYVEKLNALFEDESAEDVEEVSKNYPCLLYTSIISCIEKDMDMEQIYKEATKMTEKLKDESRMIQKNEQNIVQYINGTNYGSVTGINEGIVHNVISYDIDDIQNDIKLVKEKIATINELNSNMKNFIYELLDEAGSSILKEDDKLRDECINKFKGFIVGAGKVSASILGVLGSFASIASFFGI